MNKYSSVEDYVSEAVFRIRNKFFNLMRIQMWVQLSLWCGSWIHIRLFTWIRIWIRLFTWMRIRSDFSLGCGSGWKWYKSATTGYRPSMISLWASKTPFLASTGLNFDFDVDPDLRRSSFSSWCGSRSGFLKWCGTSSGYLHRVKVPGKPIVFVDPNPYDCVWYWCWKFWYFCFIWSGFVEHSWWNAVGSCQTSNAWG